MTTISRTATPTFSALLIAATTLIVLTARTPGSTVNDHLKPIPKGPDLRYNELLAKFLFRTSGDRGRIVVCPSGQGETAFSLYSIKKGADELTFITSVRAQKNIWSASFELDAHLRVDPSVRVTTTTAAIPVQLASAISGALRYSIRGVKPVTPTEVVPLDGTSIFFFAPTDRAHQVAAALLDPGAQGTFSEALRRLVDLLGEYCAGSTASREEVAHRIEIEARHVQSIK